MENLLKDCKVVLVSAGAAAGQTEVDSSIVDTAGFDGVAFIAILGTVVDGSVLQLKAQGNALNQTGGMTEIGVQETPSTTAATSSNTMLIVDTVFPAGSKNYRYARAALTRTAQNATVQAIVAVLYRAKSKPVALDASVLASIFGLGT